MAISSRTRKCQLGREAVAGTAVAATTIWRGMATVVDMTQITWAEEDVGQYPNQLRTYVPSEGAEISLEGVCTYEQLPHILEMGIQTVTPSGTEAPYTYTYTFATSTATTIKTYTAEYGDAEDAEDCEYVFCESFELSGAPDEAWQMSATCRGRQVTQGQSFASLTLPEVEEVLFNTSRLYIDDSGGTIGTSVVSSSFRSFSLSVTTGWVAVQTADGQLYFTLAKLANEPEIVLEITAEHDATWDSAGEKANWLAETIRLIQIKATGTSSRAVTINLAGLWETFGSIEDADGNSVLTGTFRAGYSSADTLFAQIIVANTLSALP